MADLPPRYSEKQAKLSILSYLKKKTDSRKAVTLISEYSGNRSEVRADIVIVDQKTIHALEIKSSAV